MRALFCRPVGIWALTLLAAAILLGVGFETGFRLFSPQLLEAQKEAADEASRANRLEAENESMERRLLRAQGELDACRAAAGEAAPPADQGGQANRLLRKGEAVLLLSGRLVVTLEGVVRDPDRAVLKFQALDGRAGTKVLQTGQHVTVRVDGRNWRLLLRKVFGNSASFSLSAE